MGGFQLPNTSPQHLFLLGPVIDPSAMLMHHCEKSDIYRLMPRYSMSQYEWWMAICAWGSSGLFFFNSGTGWDDVTYQLISVLWLCKYSKTYPVYNLNILQYTIWIHIHISVTLQNNRFFMFLSFSFMFPGKWKTPMFVPRSRVCKGTQFQVPTVSLQEKVISSHLWRSETVLMVGTKQ